MDRKDYAYDLENKKYLTQSEVTNEDVKEEVNIGEPVTDGSVQLEELADGPEILFDMHTL